MTLFRAAVAVILTAAFYLSPAAARSEAEVKGTWVSEDGGAKVRISPCGDGICGSIVWLRDPNDDAGKPKTDRHNPNVAQRSRPMLGLQVMSGMKPNGDGKWSGTIYNADDGKTYRSRITLLAPTKIKVEGCVLVFCKGETWTRTD